MSYNHRPPLRWERSRRGTLFLRRGPGHSCTLGIVFQNADDTYSWLSYARQQDKPRRYATEDEAADALYAVGLTA